MIIKQIINTLLLLAITAFCLVYGIVGFIAEDLKEQIKKAEGLPVQVVKIDGHTYSNLEKANALLEFKSLKETFGSWIADWPELGKLFITSLIFGALGGVIKTVLQLIRKELLFSDSNVLLFPFLGMLIGLLVLGISYVLPTLLTSSFTEIRKTSLIFFCLFSGLFSEEFISSIKNNFVKLLTTKK